MNLRRESLVLCVDGGGTLTFLMRVGRAKLETDRIIMQDKDTALKTHCCQILDPAPSQIDWWPRS